MKDFAECPHCTRKIKEKAHEKINSCRFFIRLPRTAGILTRLRITHASAFLKNSREKRFSASFQDVDFRQVKQLLLSHEDRRNAVVDDAGRKDHLPDVRVARDFVHHVEHDLLENRS